MSLVTRAVFAFASLMLLVVAVGLVAFGFWDAASGLWRAGPTGGGDALIDALGYLIVAVAVFDVAKYLFEEEVRRDAEKRSAAEARRSLTKFLSTIMIALFLEALVVVFKTAREDVSLLLYPSLLLLAATMVLVGLGVFQRLSAAVEERVGDEDEAEERREKAKQ